MRTIIVALCIFALGGCEIRTQNTPSGSEDANQGISALDRAASDLDYSEPRPLQLEATTRLAGGHAIVEGRTNLPEGTELMVSIGRPSIAYGASDKTAVRKNGTFSGVPFTMNNGPLPPGQYEIDVIAPIYDVQPTSIKYRLGPDYAYFLGPMKVKSDMGTTLEYRASFTVPGTLSDVEAKAIRNRRVREVQEQFIADCYNKPAYMEKLLGRPVTDHRGIINRCIAQVKNMKAPE